MSATVIPPRRAVEEGEALAECVLTHCGGSTPSALKACVMASHSQCTRVHLVGACCDKRAAALSA